MTDRRRSRPVGEAVYRAVVASMPDTAILLFDAEGALLSAEGSALERLLDEGAAERTAATLEDLSPALAEAVRPVLREAAAGHASTIQHAAHGRIFQVHAVGGGAEQEGVTAVVLTDVTEQREAERALRLSRFAVDRSAEAVLWMGRDARILYANDAACRLLGYASGELLALSWLDLDPAVDEESWPQRWEAVKRTGTAEREDVLRARSGGDVPVELTLRHLEQDGRAYLGAWFVDARERQAQARLRAEKEAAEAANQAKSRFLAHMSHELRTPLNSVIGFANILCKNREGRLGDRELTWASRIRDNGRHLLSLINDVLDLSRVEAGQASVTLEPVDVGEVIQEVVDQLSVQVEGTALVLRDETLPGLPPVWTDGPKLRQILTNLVGNAVKFTEAGQVVVRATPAPGRRGCVRVDVEDTGGGIPEEQLGRIFEPFHQGDEGPRKRYGGTGLGLAITRRLVDLLGYELEVQSEPGVGSTFSVYVCRTRRGAPASSTRRARTRTGIGVPAVKPGSGEEEVLHEARDALVLVVDDDTDARLLLAHALEELGCRVVTAGSGRDGLRMARELVPDLVVLDLRLPDISGVEILRRIRASAALGDVPVVVISIVGTEEAPRLEGATAVLDKPVAREDLQAALRQALRHGRRRVLVVDDDEMVRSFLSTLLSEQGLQVRTAPNGEEALKILERFPADVAVVDLVMPVMDGFGLLGALRSREDFMDLPVVVVTGRDLTTDERAFLEQEAIAVLQKGRQLARKLPPLVAGEPVE